MTIEDELDMEEIDTAELERLASELKSAVAELDDLEKEIDAFVEAVNNATA